MSRSVYILIQFKCRHQRAHLTRGHLDHTHSHKHIQSRTTYARNMDDECSVMMCHPIRMQTIIYEWGNQQRLQQSAAKVGVVSERPTGKRHQIQQNAVCGHKVYTKLVSLNILYSSILSILVNYYTFVNWQMVLESTIGNLQENASGHVPVPLHCTVRTQHEVRKRKPEQNHKHTSSLLHRDATAFRRSHFTASLYPSFDNHSSFAPNRRLSVRFRYF